MCYVAIRSEYLTAFRSSPTNSLLPENPPPTSPGRGPSGWSRPFDFARSSSKPVYLKQIAGLFTGHDSQAMCRVRNVLRSHGSGWVIFWIGSDQVGSDWIGSGRVESDRIGSVGFQTLANRDGPPLRDPTGPYPTRPDPTSPTRPHPTSPARFDPIGEKDLMF